MALADTRPRTEGTLDPEPPAGTLEGLLGSADHKTIGRLWIGTGLLVLVASLVVSAVAAFEAADLGAYSIVADADEFTQLWSLGREALLLGAIVPILVGLATYLVPLQVGAPALAFARGAGGAYWTWLLATALMITSYVLNGGPGGGRLDFVVLWIVSLGTMAAAICWALIIIATTILGARTRGMTLERVPFTTWSFLVFSLIGLFSLPILMTELVLAYVRLRAGFIGIDARQSLVGVMESANLVPALYWSAVPLLGMAADIIGVHTDRPVRAHRPVLMAIGLFGILAYGADLLGFASVRPLDFDNALLVIALAVVILPVLGVLGLSGESLRRGTPTFRVPLVGALVSGLVLLLGAVVSLLGLIEPVAVWLENETPVSVDLTQLLILNGTTFHDGVRGLILGATIVALVAALHHWAPKIWGRHLAEPLGFLAVLAVAGGSVLWGAGAVLAGVDDQAAYPASALNGGDSVEFFNLIAAIGIVLVAIGAVVAAVNVAQAAFGPNSTADDRWQGATLEWATESPPTFGNFEKAPIVRSATPLADTLEAIDEAEVLADEAARATLATEGAS